MFYNKRKMILFVLCMLTGQILTSTILDVPKAEAALLSEDYAIMQSDNEEMIESTRKGDVDGDGEVGSMDYILMRMHILGKIDNFPVINSLWASDLNGDEVFDTIDFLFIRRYVLGHIDGFPAERDNIIPAPSAVATPTPNFAPPTPNVTELPSKPIGLNYFSVSGTEVSIYWEASENIYIKDYAVFKNGEFEALTNGRTSYTFENLIPNETYEFKICAIDSEDNRSEFSDALVIKTRVSTEEEIKLALIHNFTNRGKTYSLTYEGDIGDIQAKVDRALQDAFIESNEPFILLGSSCSMSGIPGNFQITFSFNYDDENEYMLVARSADELENALLKGFYDRNEKINIVYKNSITTNDLATAINSMFNKDTYLKFCIYGYSYRISSMMGINVVECYFDFKTTKEQEDYVDRTVDFIVSNFTNTDMSDDEKEKLIHDFVLSYVDYCEDEEHGNAYSALYYGKTKCDGYSMLTYKMLKAAGIESLVVANEDHAWNLVKIDGKWYHLDTTWDDSEFKDYGFYKYYNLSDDEILEARKYTDAFGIDCGTNYIEELREKNDNSDGKYEVILEEVSIKDVYFFVNKFSSNDSLSLLYNEVVLREGESISLIDAQIPPEQYENLYQWSTSDADIATVTNGVITAKSAGTIIVAAQPMYNMTSDTGLFCKVRVIPAQAEL